MKTEDTKKTTTSAKTQLKIKSLRLAKETLETLKDHEAGAVKGGGRGSYGC